VASADDDTIKATLMISLRSRDGSLGLRAPINKCRVRIRKTTACIFSDRPQRLCDIALCRPLPYVVELFPAYRLIIIKASFYLSAKGAAIR
jgi:hypothetical protein